MFCFFDVVVQLPPPAHVKRTCHVKRFHPVWLRRRKAFRLQTGEVIVFPLLTHASFIAMLKDLTRVLHALSCLLHFVFCGRLCHLLTLLVLGSAFISSLKTAGFKLRTCMLSGFFFFFLWIKEAKNLRTL